MKCGSQSPGDTPLIPLAARWEAAFGDVKALDPEPETYELDDWLDGGEHEPVTMIMTGLIVTLWQDGNVIACWSEITGRSQSVFLGWAMTIEQARKLEVAT